MENSSTTNLTESRNTIRNFPRRNFPVNESTIADPVIEKLAEEGCEYYYKYLEQLGLSYDPNLIVIPSTHHYYFDAEDMKNVKTLINLKQLNYIKDIKEFLGTIQHIIPEKSFFIGSFVEGKSAFGLFFGSDNLQYQIPGKVDPVENGISSRIPFFNMIYDIMDSRTNRNMTRKSVKVMLEEARFKVSDMTEINGLTYFSAVKMIPKVR